MPAHNPFIRNRVRAGLAATAAVGLVLTGCSGVQNSTGGGGGDSYPSGAVEMYVGASAGGSSDLISRAVSKGLSDNLGASFPVINREGANGALAAAEVVVGLAIIMSIFRTRRSASVDDANLLKY